MPHLSTLWKAIVLSFIINYFVIASVQAATPASSSLGDDNVALETSDWGTGGGRGVHALIHAREETLQRGKTVLRGEGSSVRSIRLQSQEIRGSC